MWDRRKRSLLLWCPIIWILGTTLWLKRLRRAQAERVFEARERLLLQGDDAALNPELPPGENHKYDERREGIQGWADTEVMQPLLISLVSLSRKIVLYLFVFNLISNEIAYLYCNGHTGTVYIHFSIVQALKSRNNVSDTKSSFYPVISWVLTQLSEFCSKRDRNNIARIFLQASLYWNSWWAIGSNYFNRSGSLGAQGVDAANILKVVDPVAANLQQLALLAAKMNQHNRFRTYSRLLSERNFVRLSFACNYVFCS